MGTTSVLLKLVSLAIALHCLALSQGTQAADLSKSQIRIPEPTQGTLVQYTYFRDILRASLLATEEQYGVLILKPSNVEMVQNRQLLALESDLLDVIWTVTTKERESKFLPVRVPLINGLFGYRVFLIPQSQSYRYTQTMTVEQLKTMTAVQGFDWPDTAVLRNNGFKVATSDYLNSFKLLAQHYVDYFPRGVTEVNEELKVYSGKGITLAPNHLFYYPNYIFFFVRKENQALHDRILLGLKTMQTDGTLERLFMEQEFVQQALSLIQTRKVHVLNVDVSESTARLQDSVRQFGLH